MVDFSHPWLLAAALLLTLLCAFAYRTLARRRSSQALLYTSLDFFMDAARPRRWPHAATFGAFAIATALICSAVARPHITARFPATDAAIVLCIDTSGSMSATDVDPTRWEAARNAAQALIERTPQGTKVGVVTFSSNAAVIQAPTGDRDAARSALERLPAPGGATAIGDALTLAGQQFPQRGHHVVILLTDGVNNRGADPLATALELAARHIPVYTVGIGTNDSGLLIPGTAEPAQLDEDALRAIAQTSGGSYTKVTDAQQLQKTLAHLGANATLERRRIDASLPFALGGGLLLLLTILSSLAAGRFP